MDTERYQMLAQTYKIHQIVIMHGYLRQVYDEIVEFIEITEILRLESNHTPLDPNSFPSDGVCLTGKAGTGKTTLSNMLLKKFPKKVVTEQNLKIQTHPILFMSVQGKSINGLAMSMLDQLGDHAYKQNNLPLLTERLKVQLRTAKTNLIILDEFHELLTDNNHKKVVSWIKSLFNATNIPTLVMGTPGVESLTESNNENLRRFKTLTIDRLDYIFDEPTCQFTAYITSLIEAYQNKLGFITFNKPETATDILRFYLATNGYPSNIAELLKNAAKAAIRDGENQVTINHLSAAFDASRKIDLLIGNHNPFTMRSEAALKLHMAPITSVDR